MLEVHGTIIVIRLVEKSKNIYILRSKFLLIILEHFGLESESGTTTNKSYDRTFCPPYDKLSIGVKRLTNKITEKQTNK